MKSYFDVIILFFLYSNIGILIMKLLLLMYPFAFIYFIHRHIISNGKIKLNFKRADKVIIFATIITLLVHLIYFRPYSLDVSSQEIKSIEVINFEGKRTILQDKELIDKLTITLNNMEIKNSLDSKLKIDEFLFERQKRFTLTYSDKDLLGHIVFIRYYDDVESESYSIYIWITNKDGDGHFVKVANYDESIIIMYDILFNK